MTNTLRLDERFVHTVGELCTIHELRYRQYGNNPRALFYDKTPSNHPLKIEFYASLLQAMIKDQPRTIILDVGCGYGSLAPYIPPNQYIGIDPVKSFIAAARRENPRHRFIRTTARKFRPPRSANILAVIVGSMGTMVDPDQVLAQAYRAATVGVLVDFNDASRLTPKTANPDCRSYTLEQSSAIVRSVAGMRAVRTETEDHRPQDTLVDNFTVFPLGNHYFRTFWMPKF